MEQFFRCSDPTACHLWSSGERANVCVLGDEVDPAPFAEGFPISDISWLTPDELNQTGDGLDSFDQIGMGHSLDGPTAQHQSSAQSSDGLEFFDFVAWGAGCNSPPHQHGLEPEHLPIINEHGDA